MELMNIKTYAGIIILLVWAVLFALVGLACKNIKVNPLKDIKDFFNKQSPLGRIVSLLFFLMMTIYGGTKPSGSGGSTNDVDNVSNSSSATNNSNSIAQTQSGQISSSAQLGSLSSSVQSSNSNTASDGSNEQSQVNIPAYFTDEDFERGFVLTSIKTDENFDFSPPETGAIICNDWRKFGAATDWMYVAMTNWAFNVGTNNVNTLRVFSFGKVEPLVFEEENIPSTGYWFAPFLAQLGVVPEANEELLLEASRPSQVWYRITPYNSLIISWQNALLERDTNKPVSFQVEFNPDGLFTYRYDLSNLDSDSITNIVAGASFAGNTWATNSLSSGVTSMTFYQLSEEDSIDSDPDGDEIVTTLELYLYGTNPHRIDSDFDGLNDYEELFVYETNPNNANSLNSDYYDGLAAKLGELNPLSYQGGSTNTVLEHIFYSGTTNGVVVLPTSSEETGVLKVTVSGEGIGKLVIDDTVVPLIGVPRTRNTATSNTLLVSVGKGKKKKIWSLKPEGLEVALDSDDLFIGELHLPLSGPGWIAFPHTEATHPCIHEIAKKEMTVSLVHGEEFPGLTATWVGGQKVTVTNTPPVSAELYAEFERNQSSYVSYVVNHPKQLNSVVPTFQQEFRYCPPLDDEELPFDENYEDEYNNDENYWSCNCHKSNSCICTTEICKCPSFNCPCEANLKLDIEDDASPNAITNLLTNTYPLSTALYLYRDNIDTVSLTVPGGKPQKCCPCKEHWSSNYVAKVSHPSRISVTDNNGDNFKIAYEPCSVNVSGISPSREVGDASLLFVTNAVPYKQIDYTVLGVTFDTPDGYAPLSTYKQLSSYLGFPVTVCTNIETATSIFVKTDVLLTNGIVKLSLEKITGDISLWLPSWQDKNGNYHPPEMFLQTDGIKERYYSIKKWRNIMKRYRQTNLLELRVLSAEESKADVKIEFIASRDNYFVRDNATMRLTTILPPLRFDITRDGAINNDDVSAALEGRKFYYWVNDDINKGDVLTDSSTNFLSNAADYDVNGKHDLINLFPIGIELNKLKVAWLNRVKYIIRSSGVVEPTVKLCFANVGWDSIYSYQTNQTMTIPIHDYPSQNLCEASLMGVNDYGFEIPYKVFSHLLLNSGTMLCEAAIDGTYIKLEIEYNGKILYTYKTPIDLMPVKNMYSWYNFRYLSNDSSGRISKVNRCPGENYSKNLIFIHGANISTEQAELWGDAIFKRLWVSGMKADFYNVDWRSDIGSAVNYHQNVSNSFVVAQRIAPSIKAIADNKDTVIMAHSLGNMVVSSMIQDHGLDVSKYIMCNSAVPVEAYDNNEVHRTQKLVHVEWENYPTNSWSAYWHTLFTDNINDDRKQLKWTNRFQNVNDNIVNFYSSGDEVLNLYIDNDVDVITGIGDSIAQYAWHKQELFKGRNVPGGTDWSGWSMKRMLGEVLFSPLHVKNMSTEELKHTTVFKCQPESMNTNVIDRLTVDAHLAQGIPTLTPPTGIINLEDGNIKSIELNADENIVGIGFPNGWPARGSFRNRWLHSDLYDVPYYYNFNFYNKILEEGDLR